MREARAASHTHMPVVGCALNPAHPHPSRGHNCTGDLLLGPETPCHRAAGGKKKKGTWAPPSRYSQFQGPPVRKASGLQERSGGSLSGFGGTQILQAGSNFEMPAMLEVRPGRERERTVYGPSGVKSIILLGTLGARVGCLKDGKVGTDAPTPTSHGQSPLPKPLVPPVMGKAHSQNL